MAICMRSPESGHFRVNLYNMKNKILIIRKFHYWQVLLYLESHVLYTVCLISNKNCAPKHALIKQTQESAQVGPKSIIQI